MGFSLLRGDTRFTLAGAWAPVLALCAGAYAAWSAVWYANQPLLEYESWRQTMTALTSYWMVTEGPRLAYETPILGYPWSIPLEFPLYQAIVAAISWASGFPLDATGRVTSVAFHLACGWPAFRLARRLELSTEAAWLFCALLWSSPLYLFFGRMFLMETAAAFFTIAALPYALDMRAGGWRPALMFACVSSLGMLQKASTPLAMIIIMAVWLAAVHLRTNGFRLPSLAHLAQHAVAFGTPAVVTVLWFVYTDWVKSHNPVIYASHSSAGMAEGWLGGYRLLIDGAAQKLVLWDRVTATNAAGVVGAAMLAIGLLAGTRRSRAVVAMSALLFVGPIWLIMNQHYFLEYYQLASALFLFGAVAVAVVEGAPRVVRWTPAAPLIAVLLVGANYYHHVVGHGRLIRPDVANSPSRTPTAETTLAVGQVIKQYTSPDSAIAVFGLLTFGGSEPELGWSGEMAYYSERKSITLSGYDPQNVVWEDPAAYIGGKPMGAMVFCFRDDMLDVQYRRLIAKYTPRGHPALFPVGDCLVWLPGVREIELAGVKVQPRHSL